MTRRLPDPENDDGPYELDDAGYARAGRAYDLLHPWPPGPLWPNRHVAVIDPHDPDPCDLAGADWNDARDHEPDDPEGV